MNRLSMHLKEVRKAKCLTQDELAEKADISRVMVSRYESGTVIPTVDVLVRIADALDVSTDYLLGRPEHIRSSDDNEYQKLEKQPHIRRQSDFPQSRSELRKFIIDVLKDCIHLNL